MLKIVGDRSVSIKVGESFNVNDYFTALDIDGSKLEIIVLENYSNESPDVYELTGSTVNSLGQTVTITFMLSVEGVLYV